MSDSNAARMDSLAATFPAKFSAGIFSAPVLVGALGYFVDIYDLVLFSILRVASLKDLAVAPGRILDVGVYLLNHQMAGLLTGGILWGVLGDKRGRLSVLFGSIFLYSAANIANSFVHSIAAYAVWRFLAGVGLAGELGAAITLVCEVLPKETRGYGTMIVAGVGLCGGVVAGVVGDLLSWRAAYLVGGCLGFLLLLLRIGMYESGMYSSLKGSEVRKGDLRMLLSTRERFGTYLCCILIGVPIWFMLGILITFAPEICRALGVTGPVSAGRCILYAYVGVSIGDFAYGALSQRLKSRKKAVRSALFLLTFFIFAYLMSQHMSPSWIYLLSALLGFSTGYWAIFVTIAAEQFGTNMRATVTTTVPNFVRGFTVVLTLAFRALQAPLGLVGSAALVGLACMTLAVGALGMLRETYGRDLDYLEL